MQPMTEVEKQRSSKVEELQGKLVTIAGLRADIISRLRTNDRGMVVGNLSQGEQAKLVELDREAERVRQEIQAVELEASRREREPVDPRPQVRKLTEELANEKHRRKWFCYQLHYRGMRGYLSTLEGIERRIGELETEIERIELAEEFAREHETREAS